MKTIYKYPLKLEGFQEISIPMGAELLTVLEQNDFPVVYFRVDPTRENFYLEIRILGTGQPTEDDYLENSTYLGTITTHSGRFVWHIFATRTMAWWRIE